MRIGKILVPGLLGLLLLARVGNVCSLNPWTMQGKPTSEYVQYYIPIRWALIVLGNFDYYTYSPLYNAIQKAEHWIQSEGVPYDIIDDDNIGPPTDTPSLDKYPLQYSNGTIRYGVLVIIMNNHADNRATNSNFIYWAVGNGTNAVVFGTAAKYVPMLLGISPANVSYFVDYSIVQINCSVLKTFSDGIIEYKEGTVQTMNVPCQQHVNISDTSGKTVWYTMQSNTGKNWVGMIDSAYFLGRVFWNSIVPDDSTFFRYESGFSTSWEIRNLKFLGHSINFMFKAVKTVDIGLQGYKRWGGAITYRLDQDDILGLIEPPEAALRAGWYVDMVTPPLGSYANGGSLADGMPENYSGAPSSKVKNGVWTFLIISTEPLRATNRAFILYSDAGDANYDRVKVDWNTNKDFQDDQAFRMWENMTSATTGLMGTYYWGSIDNWENPTYIGLGWLCPLRDRISDFSWFKEMGQIGYISYGLHSWQHARNGCPSEVVGAYVYWNGSSFIMNQTWIEDKFTEAHNELAYCLGTSGYGFEADRSLVSHAGNEPEDVVDKALFDLDWVYLTYGDNMKNEPGWFLYSDRKTAMTCGGSISRPDEPWSFAALKDAVKTLFPIFGIYEHDGGVYNLTFDVEPSDTAYTDMFCFAHLDDSFEFWSNARYMWMNTVNACFESNKIILEYKANNTLKDYVWKFPVTYEGKYFNGFSDNRTIGKIKHIDGRYVYVEFSEGGNERIEALYGPNPHVYQTSTYIENITQTYTPKNLTIQLWNASGTVNLKVNGTILGQPASVKSNGAPVNFDYDVTTDLTSFNVSLGNPITMEIYWEHAPPNSPTSVSPSQGSRVDPGRSVTFTWEFSDPDMGDSQLAYRFQLYDPYDFTLPIIDTGKVISQSAQTTQALPNNVALYYWRVTTWDNRDAEGEWSDLRPMIVDRLDVTWKSVANIRTNVGASVNIYFRIAREYDNSSFEGTNGAVYINESVAEWDDTLKCWELSVAQTSVGGWSYKVSSITDTEYHITAISDSVGTQQVIWDKLIIQITPDADSPYVGNQVHFGVSAVYAYDQMQVSEFTVNVLRNGTHFATNNFADTSATPITQQYATENVSERNYSLTAFVSNSPAVTWIPKPLIQLIMEWIPILIPAILSVIVVTYLLIRERKKHKKDTQTSLQRSG